MFKICFSKEPTKCCHPSNIWGKYEDWVAISLPFIFLCTWNNFYLQVLNVTYLLCRWVLPHVTYYTFYFQLFHTFNFLINLKIRPFPMSSPDRLPKLHCKNFVCCLKQFFLCISVFTVRTVSIPDLSKMYLGKKKIAHYHTSIWIRNYFLQSKCLHYKPIHTIDSISTLFSFKEQVIDVHSVIRPLFKHTLGSSNNPKIY